MASELRESLTTLAWSVPALVVGCAAFVVVWALAVSSFGLLGLLLGWIPALIAAALAAVAWPLVLLGLLQLFH